MTVQTIAINNKDLPYTIDTYGMFTGDSTEESETDYLVEQYPELETDKVLAMYGGDLYIGFNYDHPEIVKALADSSVNIITQALAHEKPQVVKNITIQKTASPQFYNYTTDSYRADWEIDIDALQSVTPANWLELAQANGWGDYELKDGDTEDVAANITVAKLDIYLRSILTEDDYNMSMWEAESSAYYENMTPDTETQAAITKIEKARARKAKEAKKATNDKGE